MIINKIKEKRKQKQEEKKKQEEEEKKKKVEERKKDFSDIFGQIESNDVDRLNQSLDMANELLKNEKDRGESAEKRINTFFSVGAVISGLFSILGKYLVISDGNLILIIYLVYVAILVLIVKMSFYFFNSMRTQIHHVIGPKAIYTIQNGNKSYALRYEIARKILNYHDQLEPNTQKVYCLEQMQNNLILIIGYFLLLGILGILNTKCNIQMPQIYSIAIGLVLISVALIFDKVYVRIRRKFWKFE